MKHLAVTLVLFLWKMLGGSNVSSGAKEEEERKRGASEGTMKLLF